MTEHIGATILIKSVDQVYEVVRTAFGLGPIIKPFGPLEPMIAKYSIIDLEFEVHHPLLNAEDRLTVPDLQDLGFTREDWCLASLEDSISLSSEIVKLMLGAGGETADLVDRKLGCLKTGYFPRVFTVIDCCCTNASSVWIQKYVYL